MISTSQIFVAPSTQDPSSTFNITASLALNVLTVTATAQTLVAGQGLDDTTGLLSYGIAIGTQISGPAGGIGQYYTNIYDNYITSETMIVTLSPMGQAGVGSLWYQTDTHNMYNRLTNNMGWSLIGNVNTPNFGMLPRAGGALTNALTGSNGLMAKDGLSSFISPPYVNSKLSIGATQADLANLQAQLDQQIALAVAQDINSIGLPSVSANTVISTGTAGPSYPPSGVGAPVLISIPFSELTYADGTAVLATDCKAMASMNAYNINAYGINALTPGDSRGLTWYCYINQSGTYYNYPINYILIAIKPTS
jgi:hypothetical protein